MENLLSHPLVQTVAAPLLAALLCTLLLAPLRLSGLAAIAGLATTIALVSGFSFSPLTATRKVVLCSLIAPCFGIALDLFSARFRALRIVLAAITAAAAVWVGWSVLAQKD